MDLEGMWGEGGSQRRGRRAELETVIEHREDSRGNEDVLMTLKWAGGWGLAGGKGGDVDDGRRGGRGGGRANK